MRYWIRGQAEVSITVDFGPLHNFQKIISKHGHKKWDCLEARSFKIDINLLPNSQLKAHKKKK